MKTLILSLDHNTLSHELRTPLAGILGITELLNNENLSIEQKEQLKVIQQAGVRLLKFVNRILTQKVITSAII